VKNTVSVRVPERELYGIVVKVLESTFKVRGVDARFVVTADGIPDEMQKYVKDEVLFLIDKREFRPDIMGVIRSSTLGLGIFFI